MTTGLLLAAVTQLCSDKLLLEVASSVSFQKSFGVRDSRFARAAFAHVPCGRRADKLQITGYPYLLPSQLIGNGERFLKANT